MSEIMSVDGWKLDLGAELVDQSIIDSKSAWLAARDEQLSLQGQLDDAEEADSHSGGNLDRTPSDEEDRLRNLLSTAQRNTGIAKLAFMRSVTDSISVHILTYRKLRDDLTVAMDTERSTERLAQALESERATIDALSVIYSRLNMPSVY